MWSGFVVPGIVCDYMQITRRPHWGPDHRGSAATRWGVCEGDRAALHAGWTGQHPAPQAREACFASSSENWGFGKVFNVSTRSFSWMNRSVGTEVSPEKYNWKFRTMSSKNGEDSSIQGPSDNITRAFSSILSFETLSNIYCC